MAIRLCNPWYRRHSYEKARLQQHVDVIDEDGDLLYNKTYFAQSCTVCGNVRSWGVKGTVTNI